MFKIGWWIDLKKCKNYKNRKCKICLSHLSWRPLFFQNCKWTREVLSFIAYNLYYHTKFLENCCIKYNIRKISFFFSFSPKLGIAQHITFVLGLEPGWKERTKSSYPYDPHLEINIWEFIDEERKNMWELESIYKVYIFDTDFKLRDNVS